MARACPILMIGRTEDKSECIGDRCMWFIPAINECIFPAINRSIFKNTEIKK